MYHIIRCSNVLVILILCQIVQAILKSILLMTVYFICWTLLWMLCFMMSVCICHTSIIVCYLLFPVKKCPIWSLNQSLCCLCFEILINLSVCCMIHPCLDSFLIAICPWMLMLLFLPILILSLMP